MKAFVKFILVTGLVFVVVSPVLAKKTTYIYRKRANWVKLIRLSNKELAGQQLRHPCHDITVTQMVAMLKSITMNKGSLFKKGLKTLEVFNDMEARKYAPLIVKALKQAAPNQVVNVAVVHKRPYFIIRNDHISIVDIFMMEDGLHMHFEKFYAKLSGDYKQASRIDRAIKDARSSRLTLAAQKGQILLPDANEVVLDPYFDFANQTVRPAAQTLAQDEGDDGSSPTDSRTASPVLTPEASTNVAPIGIEARLQKLKKLREAKLITESEYQKKKKEILKEL